MRGPCGEPSSREPAGGGQSRRVGSQRSMFKGVGCVRCFCPLLDYPQATRSTLLGVYVDEEEAAAATATAASPVAAAAAAAAELARIAAGKLLQQWVPREWTDPRARRQLLLPGAGGIVVCSDKLLLRCSTLTGVCSSSKHLPAAACCCCFASQTPKGPLLVVGCVDGTLRVFSGRTLRLLTTLETTAVPAAANAAACASYARSSATTANERNLPYCGSFGATTAPESDAREIPQIRPAQSATVAGTATAALSSLSAAAVATDGCRLQQIPTCLLLVGNNALLVGLGGGLSAAFFIENCRLAAVYQLPPSVRCFLEQQQQQQQRQKQHSLSIEHEVTLEQLQLQQCREQAARKWRGETAKQPLGSNGEGGNGSQVQHAVEDQLPVCCLSSAEAGRLVVMAVHPEGWRGTPLFSSGNKDNSNNRDSSTLQRLWKRLTHATYHRAPPPAAAARTGAAADPWSACCSGSSNAKSHRKHAATDATVAPYAARAALGTAKAAAGAVSWASAASWPLLVFQQHTGACIGTLWGGSSRTLAMGLGKLPPQPPKCERQQHHEQQQEQYMCCLAVTTTRVHFWQQQGSAGRKRGLHHVGSTHAQRKQQQQQANRVVSPSCLPAGVPHLADATAADAAEEDATAAGATAADAVAQLEQQEQLHEKRRGDATLCPSFLCGCRASMCQLAAAEAAATAAAAAARQPVTEKIGAVAEEGSSTAAAAAAYEAAAAAEGGCVGGVWWSLRASFSLPLLLSPHQQQQPQEEWSLIDAVLDWGSRLMVATTGGSPQKPLLQRLWYNRGLLATSAADGYVRFLFHADLRTHEQQRDEVL
ncbi:hypothetical protein, conserved [Eimeria brunetti]|uniref:Uncharacterized protein n=1 Tax=Eimeria brunetti TaxID=51314 RepID=U6LWI2_9EIME|nr:hypothetical protein, conserved [Eimeria brunetti]